MNNSAERPISNSSSTLEAGAPSFPAPWTARAFAMTRTLSIGGHFTWAEWAQAFGRELQLHQGLFRSQMSEDLAYYRCWINALELLLQEKRLLDGVALQAAFEEAISNWPHPDHHAHFQPIAISPAPI